MAHRIRALVEDISHLGVVLGGQVDKLGGHMGAVAQPALVLNLVQRLPAGVLGNIHDGADKASDTSVSLDEISYVILHVT